MIYSWKAECPDALSPVAIYRISSNLSSHLLAKYSDDTRVSRSIIDSVAQEQLDARKSVSAFGISTTMQVVESEEADFKCYERYGSSWLDS